MSLVLDRGNSPSLNPIYVIGKIIGECGPAGVVIVAPAIDLLENLDATFFILAKFTLIVTKDGLILFVCPVRKLVVT